MAAVAPAPSDPALLTQAARLCAEAGRPAPIGLHPLPGGKNNRVFRLVLKDGCQLVLKSYFQHPNDTRDRLGAEWAFLSHAWGCGVRSVPEPVAHDRDAHLGLYGFVVGEKLSADAISASHVGAAADFVCSVNAGPRPALRPGSEACFSIADHLERIDRRVDRLDALDPEAPDVDRAARLVEQSLKPCWDRVRADIVEGSAAASLAVAAPFPDSDIIASPSDFGFHNALWQSGHGLCFLDFEYAGLDDPAKLAGDFFSCPEIPTPGEHFAFFVDELCRRLGLSDATRQRMGLLRDAYRIKWACIVLNDFIPHHDARRRFADQGDRAARCAAQLEKAAALISMTARRSAGKTRDHL